jgi:uncharacterized SAM-binding protein YcdF (DUF218 family)
VRRFGLIGLWVRSLLVGPLGLVVLFVLVGVLVYWLLPERRRQQLRHDAAPGIGVFLALFLGLCFPYAATLLEWPLNAWADRLLARHGLPRDPVPAPGPAAVLVLGGGFLPPGVPSNETLTRLELGHQAWAQMTDAFFLLSEGGIGATKAEQRTHELIQRLGVPADRIRLEPRSLTTQQNLQFCTPVLRELGVGRLVLVTDRSHLPRSYLVARRYGWTPLVYCQERTRGFACCPDWLHLMRFQKVVNEYIGLVGYRLLGWA